MIDKIQRLFYRLIYLSGIWLLFLRLNRRRVAIIMYHGICEDDIYIWTQVPLAEFEKQMRYISRHYEVVSIETAIKILKGKKRNYRRPLVITFDDGFKSNKTLAYPILRKYGLPAAIFLTTSFVDKEPRFEGLIKTDYIVGLFRKSRRERLDLRDQGLGEIILGDVKDRIAAGYKVSNALKHLDYREENKVISVIAERLDEGLCANDMHIFGSMDWDDIRELYKGGLVTFGAHTLNHEILTMLPRDLMRDEIERSQKIIGDRLGAPVKYFAYPNGTPDDFNNEVKEAAAEHYDCALTTINGLNRPGCDLFEIKRIGIGNDLEFWKFKLELSGINDFIRRLIKALFGRKRID